MSSESLTSSSSSLTVSHGSTGRWICVGSVGLSAAAAAICFGGLLHRPGGAPPGTPIRLCRLTKHTQALVLTWGPGGQDKDKDKGKHKHKHKDKDNISKDKHKHKHNVSKDNDNHKHKISKDKHKHKRSKDKDTDTDKNEADKRVSSADLACQPSDDC